MTELGQLPNSDQVLPQALEACLQAAEPLEFTSFEVGIRLPSPFRRPLALDVSFWKAALRRALGSALAARWEDRVLVNQRPDLLMIFDLASGDVETSCRSIYLYGRYRKLERGLPQTQARWSCKACSGKGCPGCQGTGRQYPTSVEALLGVPAAAAFRAPPQGFQLHGMGREDIDVLCLGRGRPFVLELKEPRSRQADLLGLKAAIEEGGQGQVELPLGLKEVEKTIVARIKGWEATKRYLALVETAAPVGAQAQEAICAPLQGVLLAQRTPQRVARRRSDKVRSRRIISFSISRDGERRFFAELEAQSGTYIKEFISGDEGRTEPSLTSLLHTPCVCVALDVLEVCVHEEELFGADSR